MLCLAAKLIYLSTFDLIGVFYEPVERGAFATVDGNLSTYVIFPLRLQNGFAIAFDERLKIDKIVVYNGTKSREAGRVKWIAINLREGYEILSGGGDRLYGQRCYRELCLPDKFQVEIDLKKEGLYIPNGVQLISVGLARWDDYYPGTKIKYPAISEIEFYYKGKRVDLGPIEELKKSYVEAFVKEVKWYLSYVPGKIYKRKWVAGIEYKHWDPQEPLYAKDILIRPDGVLEWRIYDRVINSRYITNKFGEDFYYKMLDWEEEHDFKTPEWEGEVTGKGKGRRICRIIEEGKGLWKFDEEGRLWFKIGNKWEHVDYEITAWDERWKERYNVYKVRFVIKNTKLRGVYFGDKGCYEEADTAR